MTGIHSCPRCELRFAVEAEVVDHLRRDHGVDLGAPPVPETDDHKRNRIVVPVDPQREPTPAVRVAGTIARQADLAVEIVAVRPPGLGEANVDAYLHGRCREAEEAGAPVTSSRELGSGDTANLLIGALGAEGVVLACLSTRSRGAVGELLLGSVADAVVRRSPVPVVLVGPHVEPVQRYGDVVVALDGSPLAEHAGRVAAELVGRAGLELSLIEVIGEEPLPPDVVETAYLSRYAARLDPSPERFDTVRSERPGPSILDTTGSGADTMVVMGTHGRTAARRLVMGSVAHDVVHRSHGPVLVVPPAAGAWEWPADPA